MTKNQIYMMAGVGCTVALCAIAGVAAFFLYPIFKTSGRPIAQVVTVDSPVRYMADGNSMGDPNAPIQMVIYSDFQCPFCYRHYTNTEPLLEQYYIDTGRVLYIYRSAGNFVSSNIGGSNTESQDAAASAYCAMDQDKFWEMHDALFVNNRNLENQGSFVPERLTEIARAAGLDVAAFKECFDTGKYESHVQKDFNDAMTLGLQGTPTFFITYKVNGIPKTAVIEGAQPFEVFQQTLNNILSEIGVQ